MGVCIYLDTYIYIYTYIYTSSMSCVYSNNNIKVTGPLTTFMISKCHSANLGRPCNSTGMQPHEPKSVCVRALQFCKYYI